MIESAVVVYGQRAKGCIVDAIPIGRQALTPTRAARRGIGTDGLHADVGNDLNGCGPVRGVGAVSASRALDHQVLVQTQDWCVPVKERDINRSIRADNRI